MQDFFQKSPWYYVWAYISALFLARYLIVAGLAYLWVWKWKAASLLKWKIQDKQPETKSMVRDFLFSLLAMTIFATVGTIVMSARNAGHTRMYTAIDDFGWLYFVFSIFVMLVIHDAYFYWAHRFMHLPKIYPLVHRVHHLSTNPSPWTAFAFHPLETFLEALILPILVYILPLHLYALVVFLFIMTIMNVIGHLGYELYPRGFVEAQVGKWNNTSTHHNMHHKLVSCNYGLYFNWWDRWMNTNHADYIKTFNKIKSRQA